MNKKIRVDFTVSSELYDLFIIDNSQWGIAQDLPAVIEITTPGRPKAVSLYFDKNEITAYNSNTLKLNCEDSCEKQILPDGIYHVKIKASPDSFFQEHDYLKADNLIKNIRSLYANLTDFSCENKCFKELMQADFMLKTAQSYVSFGDVKKSTAFYGEARRIVEKLSDCGVCRKCK